MPPIRSSHSPRTRAARLRWCVALLGLPCAALVLPALAPVVLVPLLLLAGIALALAGQTIAYAVAGHLRGLRVRSVAVGPFTLYGADDQRSLHAYPPLADTGFVELDGTRLAPARAVDALGWSLAAGPLGIALTGVLVASVGTLVSGPGWLASTLSAVGLAQLVLALLDLVPLRFGAFRSDCAKALALHHDQVADTLQAGRWLAAMAGPDAPGNWPEALIAEQEQVLAGEPPAFPRRLIPAYVAGTMLYYHYADRGDWPEAAHVLGYAAHRPRPQGRPLSLTANLDSLQAIQLALRGQNPKGARFFLDRAAAHRRGGRVLRQTAHAAILLAEKDGDGAVAQARLAKMRRPGRVGPTPVDRLVASWADEIIVLATELRERTAAPAVLVPTAPERTNAEPQTGRPAAQLGPLLCAWDPGVPSDRRAVWLWRNPRTADLLT